MVAEHVGDILSVHDLEGNFEFVSPSVQKIVGYTAEELAGRSPYDFIHPDDCLKEVRPAHQQLLKYMSQTFRCRFRHKNGHYVWLEITNDFVLRDTGQIWKLVVSSRDITLRKNLEDRIRMFENIVDVVTDSIVVTDTGERIRYVNPMFERHTGYHFDEVRGKRPGDFLQGPDSDKEVIASIREHIRNKEIGTFELKNYKKNGEPFYVRMLIQPLFGRNGEHEGFFGLQQDITRERTAREEMKQLNVRLKEKNAELKTVNKDLEEFAYIASHDLKEPLRNVIGLLRLLEDSVSGKIGEQEEEFLEMARSASDRMSRMIESLLDYSRTGYPSEALSEIRIREVLDSITRDFSKVISLKNATIHYCGPDITILGYPTAFHRLLQNLVSNSLKHGTDQDPRIEVKVAEHQHNWKISVKDNGPGIPHKDQKKIFKLFNRVSGNPDSNGIGLALCKRIAELHKGHIGVSSTPGEGATFNFSISKHLHENS